MKYLKIFEEFAPTHFSFGGDFKEVKEGDPLLDTDELKNIKFKYSGKDYNFGITEENGKYVVYKWRDVDNLENVGEFDDEEAAKALVKELDV